MLSAMGGPRYHRLIESSDSGRTTRTSICCSWRLTRHWVFLCNQPWAFSISGIITPSWWKKDFFWPIICIRQSVYLISPMYLSRRYPIRKRESMKARLSRQGLIKVINRDSSGYISRYAVIVCFDRLTFQHINGGVQDEVEAYSSTWR